MVKAMSIGRRSFLVFGLYCGLYVLHEPLGVYGQDACDSNPCFGVGYAGCIPDGMSYQCQCDVGYESTDGIECVARNECASNTHRCEETSSICIDLSGDYECLCRGGYRRIGGGNKRCGDIDECSQPTNRCDANSACRNTQGSFECDCDPGFEHPESSDKACVDIDECSRTNRCDANSTCRNTQGSYECDCDPGFEHPNLSDKTCVDIDECSRTNPCDANSTCRNMPGSYECDCDPGFEHPESSDKTCVDINECAVRPYNPCQLLQFEFDQDNALTTPKPLNPWSGECDNYPGTYECQCNQGFVQEEEHKIECLNKNECERPEDNNCDTTSRCIDTFGSYFCDCSWGYKQNPDDNKICDDIDECVEGVNGDSSVVACNNITGVCQNLTGTYRCKCYEGYTLAPGSNLEDGCHNCCVDDDECESGRNDCVDTCKYGTHAAGAPVGTNYTCGCESGRFLRDELQCSDCAYTPWSAYGPCSVTCGTGMYTRTRTVRDAESFDECNVKEATEFSEICIEPPCATTDCELTPWSVWSTCTAECGGGTQERVRDSIVEVKGACSEYGMKEERECNNQNCPAAIESLNWKPIAGAGAAAIVAAILGFFCIRSMRNNRNRDNM